MLKTLEEQGWRSSVVHPGRLVVLEGVNPIACGSLLKSAMLLLLGHMAEARWGSSTQAQRTKGLTVPNSECSLPQPFLCTAHPVFRFQATYLSNLRGVTPRPAGSFRPQLSFPPGLQREEAGLGVDPLRWLLLRGVPLGCPSGTASTHSSVTGAGDAACRETLSWRLWCKSWGV